MAENHIKATVERFGTVDVQSEREDKLPHNFEALQNLWEKDVGVLETRPGSSVLQDTFPSKISAIDACHKFYDKANNSVRIAAAHCTQDVSYSTSPLGNITLSFTGSGRWNNATIIAFSTGYVSTDFDYLLVRQCGYGTDKWTRYSVGSISGYASNKLLRVVINTPFDANTTSIELYVTDPSHAYELQWCGAIDVQANPTGTFDFSSCPLKGGSGLTLPVSFQTSKSTTNLLSINKAGISGVTSTFNKGEVVYFAWLNQTYVFDSGYSTERSVWGNVNYSMSDIKSVAIPEDGAWISTNATGADYCRMLVVGRSPQTLQPHSIQTASFVPGIPAAILKDWAPRSPSVVNFDWTSSSAFSLGFRVGDFSTRDCFIEVQDNGTVKPIFISRLHDDINKESQIANVKTAYLPVYAGVSFQIMDMYGAGWNPGYGAPDSNALQQAGNGSKWKFKNYSNGNEYYAFAVNDYDVNTTILSSVVEHPYSRSGTNYYVCDGTVAAQAIMDYQSTPVRVPACSVIEEFETSIVLAAGNHATVDLQSVVSDSTETKFVFSRAGNPFDFTEAGSTPPVLNFVQVPTPEKISSLGIYTNTSGTEGPIQQLVIGKKNSIWVQTSLSVSGQTALINLSKKAGIVGDSIVNTPIGTLVAASDNIYLLRGNGEPIPVGNEISKILQRSDLSRAVACYHDQHYKLSFEDDTYPGTDGYNNVEWWLDIRKMKLQQGQPSWKGPMIGRQIDYVFVEDYAPDGIQYDTSRTRLAVDIENFRLINVDELPLDNDTSCQDFGTNVTWKIETGDLDSIQQGQHNTMKSFTRYYWKAKINTATANVTEDTYLDGSLHASRSVTFARGNTDASFITQALKTNVAFPVGRDRGRTIRKVLTSNNRIGIAGFEFLFKPEARLI